LLMFLILNAFLLNAKNDFKIEEIQVSDFDVTTSKLKTNNFRFEQTDYIVIQPKNNSYNYLNHSLKTSLWKSGG